MIRGYKYPILESLLPPPIPTNAQNSIDGKRYTGIHDFTRLYHLSACAIMRDEDIAQRILPLTPAMFFKPLLQAAILNNFYKKGQIIKLVPGSLIQLILHWPHESFVLRELLPPLPPPNFTHMSSLRKIEIDLFKFYEEIVYNLLQVLLGSKGDNFERLFNSSLKRLDVSGYDIPALVKRNPYEMLNPFCLWDSIKSAYNLNCPTVCDKLQLICDVRISVSDGSPELYALDRIAEINSHQNALFKVIFRRVVIYTRSSPLQNNLIVSLMDTLYDNGTEFIELQTNDVEEIATCLYPQLQGVSLSHNYIDSYFEHEHNASLTSLAFLNKMSNLQQLDLSGCRLRNKLAPLCCLPKGLTFLKMVECGLNGEDMKVLQESHHTKTLLQLNISVNKFALPIDASGLIEFCQVLESVEILEINDCMLNELTPDLLGKLFESLTTLPKLSLLYLIRNDFSSSLLSTHIKILHTCMSLRCVCLTMHSDVFGSDDSSYRKQTLQSKIDSEINYNRETVIYVMLGNFVTGFKNH